MKWSNPGKGVAPSHTPWCSSYWKGSLLVILDYSSQLYLYINRYRRKEVLVFKVDVPLNKETKWNRTLSPGTSTQCNLCASSFPQHDLIVNSSKNILFLSGITWKSPWIISPIKLYSLFNLFFLFFFRNILSQVFPIKANFIFIHLDDILFHRRELRVNLSGHNECLTIFEWQLKIIECNWINLSLMEVDHR